MEQPPSREELEKGYEKNAGIFFQMGLLAHDWAALEFAVSQLTWTLADVHPAYGACMTSQIYAVNSRMKAIVSLMGVRGFDEADIKAMNKMSRKIAGAGDQRNRVLHDSIGVERGTERFRRTVVTADRRLVFEGKVVTSESIQTERAVIIECLSEFLDLSSRILAALPALRDRPASELSPIEMSWTDGSTADDAP